MSILNKVLKSVFFKVAVGKAPRYAQNADSILKLLKQALSKTQTLGVGGIADTIREQVTLLGRLLKAYASGEYRNIEVKNLLKIVAGLIYFISPIDIIPDFIPMLGLTDDIALLVWIIGGIKSELDRFKDWELGMKS